MGFVQNYFDWLTPEIVIPGWRQRLERVAEEEAAYFGSLPYVRAVAVIGSVGRGSPWPLSDVDIMVVTDLPEDVNPQKAIHEEELIRRKRLEDTRIPVELEADLWAALRLKDIEDAVKKSDEDFLSHLDSHWYWKGLPVKAQGARVFTDTDGVLRQFIDRCNRTLLTNEYRRLWLGTEIDDANARMNSAGETIRVGDWDRAAKELLAATSSLMCGWYAVWGRVPESLMRCVTRFEQVARDCKCLWAFDAILDVGRLSEEDTAKRFASFPEENRRMVDIIFQIRHQAGEDVSKLGVIRDSLHSTSHIGATCRETDGWDALDQTSQTVQTQYDSAKKLIDYLVKQRDALS